MRIYPLSRTCQRYAKLAPWTARLNKTRGGWVLPLLGAAAVMIVLIGSVRAQTPCNSQSDLPPCPKSGWDPRIPEIQRPAWPAEGGWPRTPSDFYQSPLAGPRGYEPPRTVTCWRNGAYVACR